MSASWITPTTLPRQSKMQMGFHIPSQYGMILTKGGTRMSETHLPHNHGQTIEQELAHMPSTDEFQTVADIFKQLGDGSRIRIFWLLCHCEECVINLAAMVHMSSPAASHHLKQLKASRLIVSRREGKEVYYKAAQTEQAQLLHHIIEHLVEIACPAEAPEKGELT